MDIDDTTEGEISIGTNTVQVLGNKSSTKGPVSSGIDLTFTSANWDTPQVIRVTGVDNIVVDGDITYNLTVSIVDTSSDAVYQALADVIVRVTNQDYGEPCQSNTPLIGSINVMHAFICGLGSSAEIKVNLSSNTTDVEYFIDNGTSWLSSTIFSNRDGGIYQVLARHNDSLGIICSIGSAVSTEVKCILDITSGFNITPLKDPLIPGPSAVCNDQVVSYSSMDSVQICKSVMVYDEYEMALVEEDSCCATAVVPNANTHTWFSSKASGTEVTGSTSPTYDVDFNGTMDSTILSIFITDSSGDIYNVKKTVYILRDEACETYRCKESVHLQAAQMVENQLPTLVTMKQFITSDGTVK